MLLQLILLWLLLLQSSFSKLYQVRIKVPQSHLFLGNVSHGPQLDA